MISAALSTVPRLATQTTDKSNLWQARHMHSICRLENKYLHLVRRGGCPAHSLPYYIAVLNNRTSCFDITPADMRNVLHLLTDPQCYELYAKQALHGCYLNRTLCAHLPAHCWQHDAVFILRYYLLDTDFLESFHLVYSLIIYRRSWGYDDDSLFEHFLKDYDRYRIKLRSGDVQVRAMDFFQLYDAFSAYYLIIDLPFYALAMVLVVLVLYAYLGSVPLMLSVFLNVVFSCVLSYVLYHLVFGLSYFTFVNILAFLLLVAVGSDDVFILFDIWRKYRFDHMFSPDIKIEDIMKYTLHHGILSIFVTSFTTAAALFANAISTITALKAFGIFGGVCIISNFYFMITLVPAILVLSEQYDRRNPERCAAKRKRVLAYKFARFQNKLWGVKMPRVILKPWFVWLTLTVGMGIASLVVVFYWPGLHLQSSDTWQVCHE